LDISDSISVFNFSSAAQASSAAAGAAEADPLKFFKNKIFSFQVL
jgi:hypothetical protein